MVWPGLPVTPTTEVMLMMRPCRRRIIGWVSSRVSRNTAVRLTSSTVSQSASAMRTNSPSLVMPALLTRMSTPSRSASTFWPSALTSSRLARFAGNSLTRSPSSAASVSSFSTRVPCRPTTAPCACSTLAIASPMPPDAPVTSALRPVNSNMSLILFQIRTGRRTWLPVAIVAVAYCYHQNDEPLVLHIADNSLIPNPVPPKVAKGPFSGLPASRGSSRAAIRFSMKSRSR
ncbi:hypothetical protein MES5069_90080 [Mesorhizobium escarrei]|uniref:Uncharacterized protein n=1 Tax=Mesorhizobium escarrei TaxID=666018 RepID=A0ABM9EJJ9_9HYPH|nr:hypothetical protein MES5069_90080 [Mesorhizobium escarrei]